MMTRRAKAKTYRKSGGGVSLDIHGDVELIAALAKVSKGVRTRVLRAGCHVGMDLVTAAVKARAPVRTGKLKASIKTANGKTNSKWKVRVVTKSGAGDFRGDTFYSAFVEYGTKNTKPHPFMGPGFDESKVRARAVARRAILEGIENEVWWASFRKTGIGRLHAKASRSYRRASKSVARGRKRIVKTSRRLAKRTSRSVSRVRKRTSRSVSRVRKRTIKRAKTIRKRVGRRAKAVRKTIRRTTRRKRRRR